MRRVVITGVGALTPIGNTYKAFAENLKKGISGAGLITRFDASLFKVRFACELKDFDVEQFIQRKEARRLDPFAQYALVTAEEAMLSSGLDIENIDLDRAGVIWGTGIGGFETIEHDLTEAAHWTGEPRYSPFLIPKEINGLMRMIGMPAFYFFAETAVYHISVKIITFCRFCIDHLFT